MTTLYACADVRLDSEIPLGELAAAPPGDPRDIVTIRRGALPAHLPGADDPAYGLQAAGDTALLHVTATARYRIRAGREITVDALPGASDRNVRLFLLGSALGVLFYQRGLLPLHANAVVLGDGAVAFAGPSGAGKSTLAAHFAAAGHPVLCDDVCLVSFDAAGRPLAWPGLPRLKLWADAAQALGRDPATLDRAIDGLAKFHLPIGAAATRPLPLRRFYTLARAGEGEAAGIARLGGAAAMAAVMTNSYRALYLPTLGLQQQHFRQCAALLRHVEVHAATRAWGFDVFEREAAALARHAAA